MPLLCCSPLCKETFPLQEQGREKRHRKHQAWYIQTKCKHLFLRAISRQNTAECTRVGWSVVGPLSSLYGSCPTLPCDGTFLNRGLSSIASAKDVVPIPPGKQIFVLSEAIPLLFLQNHQFWPLKTLPHGKEIPFFFFFK